jgi:hypothetical protein
MNKINQKSFIRKFTAIWGETAFDLSQVNYQDYDTPVIIKCNTHNNIIERTPRSCLERRKYPCKICGMEKRPGPTKRKNTKEFIQQAQSIHGDLYDYSQVNYTGGKNAVTIICKEHGPFNQQASVHLTGCGCPICGGGFRWDKDTFIKESKKIHKDKYDYSQFKYVNFKTQSVIICPKHGPFLQDPDHHIMGHGCPNCGKSKSASREEVSLLSIVKSIYPSAVGQYRGWNLELPNNEIDIYVPELKIGFEFNGIFYHGCHRKELMYHKDKTDSAEKCGIRLYHLWDWTPFDLNKSIILQKLGHVEQRFFARKGDLRVVSIYEANRFYSINHLQGQVGSSPYHYGLFFNGQLTACMSFRKFTQSGKSNVAELCRFATLRHTQVVGAMSRLLYRFEKSHPEYSSIVSFGNRDICPSREGSSYVKIGFTAGKNCDPILFYYDKNNCQLRNRQKYMKYKQSFLWEDFNPALSEFENCVNHGIYPFMNSGRWKFVKKNNFK